MRRRGQLPRAFAALRKVHHAGNSPAAVLASRERAGRGVTSSTHALVTFGLSPSPRLTRRSDVEGFVDAVDASTKLCRGGRLRTSRGAELLDTFAYTAGDDLLFRVTAQ
jgi:hypothetical protein